MIDILLATYNGEKYIDTQISSIVNQTFSDWKLYIHDDGSSDSTVEKLKDWQSRDSRINFIDDGVIFHNPGKHFMHLLNFSNSDLVCFCDQDDLWLEYKLQEMIENFDLKTPKPFLLVSGCYLWKTESKEILPKIEFNKAENLEQFLFLNGGLQGCAMMFNSEVKKIVLRKETENLYMHDYLISLVAFSFGKVKYLNENLFLYRQYENNVSVHLEKNKSEHRKIVLKHKNIPVVYKKVYENVYSFFENYKDELSKEKSKVIQNYLKLKDEPKIKRFFEILFSNFALGKNGKLKLMLKIFIRPFWSEIYD